LDIDIFTASAVKDGIGGFEIVSQVRPLYENASCKDVAEASIICLYNLFNFKLQTNQQVVWDKTWRQMQQLLLQRRGTPKTCSSLITTAVAKITE